MTERYLRGSIQQCPKCGSRRVNVDMALSFKGYGPGLAACPNCRTLWEPFNPADIWDRTDPHCSFREPCNNCAFRSGSDEQRDRERWLEIIAGLKQGASFYCHKGVPISATSEHGFAYPSNRQKLRVCRGYLKALPRIHKGLGALPTPPTTP